MHLKKNCYVCRSAILNPMRIRQCAAQGGDEEGVQPRGETGAEGCSNKLSRRKTPSQSESARG